VDADRHWLTIPPQDINLETGILASLLYGTDIELILGELRADQFYKLSHQQIFKACRDVYAREKVIDAKLVMSNLKDTEIPASYLIKLMDEPTPSSAEAYCKKLVQLYQLRRIIEVSNAASKRAFTSKPEEAVMVIDYLSSEIVKIDSGMGSGWIDMQTLVMECMKNLEELQERQGITGIPSGFSAVDNFTCGWQSGDLIILAARPGCGKTAFVINSSTRSAKNGFKNGFMSLEMSKIPIGNRYLSADARLNSSKFRSGYLSHEDWEKLTESAGVMSALPIWIDDAPKATIHEVQSKARAMRIKHGLDILWVDYLGFLDGDKTSKSKVQEIESITRGMKALAKELGIPVVLLSQLNRECEKRDNKRPQLADLRDSGAIEQDADVVLFLYRDAKYNEDSPEKHITECQIAKQRNGPTARVKLLWTDEFMRLDNLERA
jgi:replicative DNA helicase